MLKKSLIIFLLFYFFKIYSMVNKVDQDLSKIEPKLQTLATQAVLKDIYVRCNGIKECIENYITLEFITKKDLRHFAINLAKEYFYQFGKIAFSLRESRSKQFLNIEIEYGFSIQELLDHKKILISEEAQLNSNNLDLSYLKINSLNGLENILNIENLVYLDLSHNQIETLDAKNLIKANSLEWLILENNYIEKINFNFFNIDKIKIINLAKNKITSLEFSNITILKSIEMIDLRNNPLDKQFTLAELKNTLIYNKIFL